MKLHKWFSRISLFCLGFVLLFLVVSQRAEASEPLEIAINYDVPDVTFELYRVGDIAEDGTIQLTGTFAEYPVAINHLDSAGWKSAAEVLTGFAYYDGVVPLQTGVTDAEGKAILDADGTMTKGLYLIVGQPYIFEGVKYYTQPLLISMPTVLENGKFQYSVEINPKYEELQGSPAMTVVKIWKDMTEDDRTSELTAILIDRETKEVFKSAVLNEGNNWRYTFEELPLDRTWYVIEKTVGDNYKMSVEYDGDYIMLINTHIDTLPEDLDPPSGPDSEEPENPEIPDVPDEPTKPDVPEEPDKQEEPDEPKLPQTGVLWWPVPILAAAGLIFLLIGLVRRKQYD